MTCIISPGSAAVEQPASEVNPDDRAAPERSARISSTLVQLVAAEAAQPLSAILDDTQRNAGTAGLLGLVLLLFNGSNLFSNMASVFNESEQNRGRVYR
jgi:uncharacterized BrkB/YihY/UPF0761 family membrane protein